MVTMTWILPLLTFASAEYLGSEGGVIVEVPRSALDTKEEGFDPSGDYISENWKSEHVLDSRFSHNWRRTTTMVTAADPLVIKLINAGRPPAPSTEIEPTIVTESDLGAVARSDARQLQEIEMPTITATDFLEILSALATQLNSGGQTEATATPHESVAKGLLAIFEGVSHLHAASGGLGGAPETPLDPID